MWPKMAIGGAVLIAVIVGAVVLLKPRTETQRTAGEPAAGERGAEEEIRIDFGARRPAGVAQATAPGGQMFGGLAGEFVTLAQQPALFISGQADVSPDSQDKSLETAYRKIRAYIDAHGLTAAGPPFAITESFDYKANIWKFKAGIPLKSAPANAPGKSEGIALGSTYAGLAVRFVHMGDPNAAQPTYAKIEQWLRSKGLSAGRPTWEEYISDPSTPLSDWRTNIYVPVG